MAQKSNCYVNTITGIVSFEDAFTKYKYVLPNEHLHSNLSLLFKKESFTTEISLNNLS